MPAIRTVDPDPDRELRIVWGTNLADVLKTFGWSRKRLILALAEEFSIEVTEQAVSQWCTGATAPRPSVQGAIAALLRVPTHLLFPVPWTERKLASATPNGPAS